MNRFNDPQESDVPDLVQFVRHGENKVKKDAAFALGTIGNIDCIDAIRRALADEDDYVRSYAMMGIGRGITARRCADEFLNAVFPALVQLLDRRVQSVGGDAPLLLLSIDQERAIPILYSPRYFTTINRELHYILRALNRHQLRIPHDRLLPLLTELKGSADTYPRDYTYGEALTAYGIHADSATDEWLRSELHSSNKRVREGAATGLLALHGISKPYPFSHVCRLMEEKGFKKLTEPQKHVYAVSTYRGEVENGVSLSVLFQLRRRLLEISIVRTASHGCAGDRKIAFACRSAFRAGRCTEKSRKANRIADAH
jgi:hypothetical protein